MMQEAARNALLRDRKIPVMEDLNYEESSKEKMHILGERES